MSTQHFTCQVADPTTRCPTFVNPAFASLTSLRRRWWCRLPSCCYATTQEQDLRRHYREWHPNQLSTHEPFDASTYANSRHILGAAYVRGILGTAARKWTDYTNNYRGLASTTATATAGMVAAAAATATMFPPLPPPPQQSAAPFAIAAPASTANAFITLPIALPPPAAPSIGAFTTLPIAHPTITPSAARERVQVVEWDGAEGRYVSRDGREREEGEELIVVLRRALDDGSDI
jgi:hypothetical protein